MLPAAAAKAAAAAVDTPCANGSFSASEDAAPSRAALPLKLRMAACCLPHPDKAHYGGEDAHFISNVGSGSLGVADGVGGWAESGVNPAGGRGTASLWLFYCTS